MTSDQRIEALIEAMLAAGRGECKKVSADLPELSMATISLAIRLLVVVSPSLPMAKETMVIVMNDLFSQAERGSEAVN